MSYTLDDAGNRTERTDDNGTQAYTYDDLYRLTGVTYPDDSTADYTSHEYDPFGALASSSGSQDNAFTFTGEQTDGSTDLLYLRARYLDRETGRFVSRDPYKGSVWMPSSMHPFTYASNNPCTWMDPSGLATESKSNSRACHATDAPALLFVTGTIIADVVDTGIILGCLVSMPGPSKLMCLKILERTWPILVPLTVLSYYILFSDCASAENNDDYVPPPCQFTDPKLCV